jgi:hypothetical protein
MAEECSKSQEDDIMISVMGIQKDTRFTDFSVERYERNRNAVIRDAASRSIRGNVAVQQGRYMTHAALEDLRDELAARVSIKAELRS